MSTSKTKYIIVDNHGVELPVIFSELMVHQEVAHALGYSDAQVLGAGFCEVGGNDDGTADYNCFGESVSLRVMSRRRQDAEILNLWCRGY